MKLLFDQNLSPRLAIEFALTFPGSAHVRDFGLQPAEDQVVWEFAKAHGFTIVSKDDDFHQRSFVYGHPPKVVWVALRNCSTETVAGALRRRIDDLLQFNADPQSSFLVLT